jgi:hypothetical protein
MSIFDKPQFKKSPNGHNIDRLEFRHKGIIDWNREHLEGKSVLDIGYHDGRWSYAAALAGAKHIKGIEITDLCWGSEGLIQDAGSKLRIWQGDAVEELPQVGIADTALCLGFLYHTFDCIEILRKLGNKVDTLVLDTMVNLNENPIINIRPEGQKKYLNNPATTHVAVPSKAALELILNHCGFRGIEYYDYPKGQKDYDEGRRVTLRAFTGE